MVWREALGLLIVMAMCYFIFSYAVVNMPQNSGASPEGTREDSQPGKIEPRTDPASSYGDASEGETKRVTVRVTGAQGQPFGINYGNLLSNRSIEGVVPAEYEVLVRTDPASGDYAWAEAWKTSGNSKELRVQIVDNGKVIREWVTTEDYGSAYVRWGPNEKEPPSGETTAAREGTRIGSRP